MQIKLVIWDLDETLWQGTLAEGDTPVLFARRAEIIRLLNQRGVVNAICSKNDLADARTTLEGMGLWDEFVFPHIAFSPKGEAVRRIIENMQLRPVNVLFVDDNTLNLEEARAAVPELNLLDITAPGADEVLEKIVADNEHVRKSRIEEYRIHERRTAAFEEAAGSREAFLHSCQIRVCLVDRSDNLPFAARIEELINRSNQMNFTKSRVAAGSMADYILDIAKVRAHGIFAWDKFGYNGLIGFAAVEGGTMLRHFVFSCHIMHMGIEQRVLDALRQQFGKLDLSAIPVTPQANGWVGFEQFTNAPIRDFIMERERKRAAQGSSLRIMANCQSGALAHFAGLVEIADSDNYPRIFSLQHFALGEAPPDKYPASFDIAGMKIPALTVYTPAVDYTDDFWSPDHRAQLDTGLYADCAARFAADRAVQNGRCLVILPPADPALAAPYPHKGATSARIAAFNAVWEAIAASNPAITLLRVGTDVPGVAGDFQDFQHYHPALMQRIATEIATWHAAYATTSEKSLTAA